MADDDSRESESMRPEKALFGIWLAFLIAVLALYLVVGLRHG